MPKKLFLLNEGTYRSDPRIAVLDFTLKALRNIVNNLKPAKYKQNNRQLLQWWNSRDSAMLILARRLERHVSRLLASSSSCSFPDVEWRASKQQQKWPFAFWNFYLSKGTRVSHKFLARLLSCLYSTPFRSSWFLLKEKSKNLTKESPWFTFHLRARSESEPSLCWRNCLLRNSFSLLAMVEVMLLWTEWHLRLF